MLLCLAGFRRELTRPPFHPFSFFPRRPQDDVNRRKSLDILLEYSTVCFESQFILLTPQDLSHIDKHIDGKTVRVCQMAEARAFTGRAGQQLEGAVRAMALAGATP